MASIHKRTGKRGTTYRILWREPDGTQQSKTFKTHDDARRFANRVEYQMDTDDYVTRAAGRATFRDVAERWRLEEVFHRPTTAYSVESRLRTRIYPTFGHRPIASITRGEIQRWVNQLTADGYAPRSVVVFYRQLATVFRAAVTNQILTRNPCTKIRLPKIPAQPIEAPAIETITAIWAVMPDRYRPIVTVAAGAGMRLGELLALTVDRVDFLRRTIKVDRQAQNVGGGPVLLVPYPKTDAGFRTIPVSQDVTDTLAAHIAAHGTGTITTPTGKAVDGLIFTTPDGQPIRRGTWGQVWRRARTAAGVDFKGVHQLRHLYASALIRQGLDAKELQRRMGDSSIAVIYDTYGHLWPNDEDRTRDALAAAYGPGFLTGHG